MFQAGIRSVLKRTKDPVWCQTTSVSRSEPVASSTLTAASVSDSSYEIICAEARMPPKSEYLFDDAQPAMVMPYTLSEASANTSSRPMPRSAMIGSKIRPPGSTNGRPQGTTAMVVIAGIRPNAGASV